jgi:transposase
MSKDASLPADVATLQQLLLRERQVVASMAETISEQQQKLQQQEHRLAQLLRQMYGPRSERFNPDQLTLFDTAELMAIIQETTQPASAGVPRKTIAYELTADERRCPCCGELWGEIVRERSEQLEYIPPQYKVLVHERSKYSDQVPLYRQEDVHARHGIILRRSTLRGWIAAAADLIEPLYRRLCQLVPQSRIVWTHDTTVKLLDPLLGRARTARFWAYLGDRQRPVPTYDFTDSRNRDGPQSFLKEFRGYLQADAYGGYDGI